MALQDYLNLDRHFQKDSNVAIRGLRHLIVGQNIGGQNDRESLTTVDENYLLEAINLRQIERGIWETRSGFTRVASLTSPFAGQSYTSQFDYQSTEGRREHLGVVGTTILKDGVGSFSGLTSATRGRWISWSINNIAYYFKGLK